MSKQNYFTQLPTWAKGIVAIAVVGGVAVIGYNIYKKIKKGEQQKGAKKELDAAEQARLELMKKGVAPSLDAFKISQIANQLHTAMDGLNTDEPAIYRAFTNVKNDLDVINLNKAYGIRKLSSGSWNPVGNYEGTLGQSLSEELNPSEIKALNEMLAKKGIKYRY